MGHMLRTDALEYDLPSQQIARAPAAPRDSARLLVADRAGALIEHAAVRDLPRLLRAGDLLVFNTTRVLPARFEGVREDSGGRVRGLYQSEGERAGEWISIVKARRFRPGAAIRLLDRAGEASGVTLSLIERVEEDGAWRVVVDPPAPAPEVLGGSPGPSSGVTSGLGRTPLPPYILSARREAGETEDADHDDERYQTVYAAAEAASVAAPTAGLHFTPELLNAIAAIGVERADVTLHVGAGTFKPVESEFVEDHPMHAEWCSMSSEAIRRVRAARADPDRRVIAVGTTTARTLEAYAAEIEATGREPDHLRTRLLITPGHSFRWMEGLMTNFHLPRSTLLAMVSGLLDSGLPDAETPIAHVDRLLALYAAAIAEGYRFYSFGDAMLIAPAR